jgi:endonuclease/exonuclease/phosphatase family metal-dependent hydrolase
MGGSCMPEPDLAANTAGAGAAAVTDAEREQIRAAPKENEPLVALTWNVEWLGDLEHGPTDEARQLALALDSLIFADADLVGLQEVSSPASAQALVESLPGYAIEVAEYAQRQKVALLYRKARFERLAVTAINTLDDAGRPPLEVELRLPSGRELTVIVLHAKAGSDPRSYQTRKNFAEGLSEYLARQHAARDVMILGDFNDLFTSSTLQGFASPYRLLTADGNYVAVTASLEAQAERSTAWGATVDHVVLSRALASAVVPGSVETLRDELLARHPDFFEAASDHAPVWVELTP